MTHALVTIVAPLALDRVDAVRALIDVQLHNPPLPEVKGALDGLAGEHGVHFMSLHAIPSGDGTRAHIVFEYSADAGPGDADALGFIVERIGTALEAVFGHARDWRGGDLRGYLRGHIARTGHSWSLAPGLAFDGTPGLSVGRIRDESALGARIAALLGAQERGMRPLDRVEAVRKALKDDGDRWDWALESPPAPLHPGPQLPTAARIAPLAWSFVKTYLWPLFPLVLLVLLATFCVAKAATGWVATIVAGLTFLLTATIWLVLLLIVAAAIIYLRFRSAEDSDSLDERAPERAVLAEIRARENAPGYAHNHMISITELKPGFIRMLTSRLAFWIIAELARLSFRPGFLGNIGTIHFARWVTVPGTRDFLFLSNFGGSWESYLEDFITKAHDGLTAVWSNTVGFPRTRNLFQAGATDGERFKRYARRSMLHTPFWYSAYPALTTSHIRVNGGIRRGLAAVLTDEEAIDWLALFGSALRPAAKLESSQIQSLVFGGLGFMPYGQCLILSLGDDRTAARAWLDAIMPDIAFDDGRRLEREAVLTLALAPTALTALGLPDDALETFPPAYLDGMTAAGRDRVLGDTGPNAADRWWWAKPGARTDAVVLVYGKSDAAVAELAARVEAICAAPQCIVHRIALDRIPEAKGDRKEPFGFVDGTSQPVIRGTYRGLRNADPIHLVEPGEFILGYPDNRNNMPPAPQLAAIHDPDNCLPIAGDCDGFSRTIVDAPRDLARNGSFLVVRQLEQEVERFGDYCENEAARLQGRLAPPYKIDADFIGAKLVGRWPDGSSLVRFPYESETTLRASRSIEKQPKPTARPMSAPEAATPILGAATPTITAPVKTKALESSQDNDFLYGTEDPEALRCPFGAHIRRANPRDSLDPGSAEQIEITNRHRILRVGRSFPAADGRKPGLLFMCLNGDIERQFEFVQQTWLASPAFHGLESEVDPLVGDGSAGLNGFTVPTRDAPVRLTPMQQFVTTRGGGYFFLPGKRLLQYMSE